MSFDRGFRNCAATGRFAGMPSTPVVFLELDGTEIKSNV